jgi:hypothetical protein
MRLECAVLCDSATFRDDLLNILGAGVTGMDVRQDFPQHLTMMFAFRAVLESREQRPRHMLRLRLTDLDGRALAQAEVVFTLREEAEIVSGEEAAVAAAVPLSSFAVPRAGQYLIEANFGQQNVGTFPIRVRRAD